MIYHFKIKGMETKKPTQKPVKKTPKTKKIPAIKVDQLKNIDSDLRKIINTYIDEKKMSVHGFAKMCGVHPNQMYMFLNMDRGLNITTVQRIGEILTK